MEWRSSALGWQGVDPNSERANTLRQHLVAKNGTASLTICEPDDYARITECFYRDGFVVVHSVITGEALHRLQVDCDEVMVEIVNRDQAARGNRGSHRYSFGSTSTTGAQLHHEGWFQLIEHPALNAIVRALFQSEDYICLLYTSPSPRDRQKSRMPSSA